MPDKNPLALLDEAAKRLGATHVIACWGGQWARHVLVEKALVDAHCKPGEPVLLFPCGPEGYVDEDGRVHPGLKQKRVAGFRAKVIRDRSRKLTAVNLVDWNE